MAIESVSFRLAALANGKDSEQLRLLVGTLVDALQALTAKLDADAGVTDTNYAAVLATYIID